MASRPGQGESPALWDWRHMALMDMHSHPDAFLLSVTLKDCAEEGWDLTSVLQKSVGSLTMQGFNGRPGQSGCLSFS